MSPSRRAAQRPGAGRTPRLRLPARLPRRPVEDRARPRVTGRAGVLVLVVVALVMSFASSLRAYVDQRRQLADLRSSIAESEEQIAALEREKRRWQDPAYVVAQARERLVFGFPGEIGYQVLDEDGRPLSPVDPLSAPRTFEDPDPEWWQITVASLETAGRPPQPKPEAVTRILPPTEDGGGGPDG